MRRKDGFTFWHALPAYRDLRLAHTVDCLLLLQDAHFLDALEKI
jgi:hypothetical protein